MEHISHFGNRKEKTMAKDDMHVIIYKLLSYLYECMKKDKAVDEELLTNTTFLEIEIPFS